MSSYEISKELQETLWNLPHSSAEKAVAGKLSICLNMPVIIKCNIATELGITNGQEGHIASWQSSIGAKGQAVIDTVFIRLQNPPFDITLTGLPKNVVPLSRTTTLP